MKISGDARVISHFYRDEKASVYSIIYDPKLTLEQRCADLDELLVEMKVALSKENELKKEHADYLLKGGKLEQFDEWLKKKFEDEKKAQEEKAVPVEEVPIVEPKVEAVSDAIIEEVKKD